MGVAGILPCLRPIIHKIDMRNLRNESCNVNHTSSSISNQSREDERRGLKRPLAAIHGESNSVKTRVGIDIYTWIAQACHGRGAILLDERHLTNSGRAEMFLENKEQPQHQEVGCTSAKSKTRYIETDGKSNEGIALDANFRQKIERQRELQLEFVSDTATSVVRKVISLKLNLSANVLVVFDGASPPIKKRCCQSRKANRDFAAKKRDELDTVQPQVMGIDIEKNAINLNNKIKAAKRAGAHNSKIHCSVVSAVMKLLRDEKISFLVAPYEADGQLAYLSNNGFLDLIVSEDSDFIGYGVEAVLYKYKDIVDGEEYKETSSRLTGDLLRKSDFGATASSFSLAKFSNVMLSVLLVAAGCDYCNSLRGVGIVTARNIVEKAFEVEKDQTTPLERVIQYLFESSTAKFSSEEKGDYEYRFLAALAMFRHPVVFDPLLGTCLFEGPPDQELMAYKPYRHIVANESNLSEIVGYPYDRKLGIYVAEGWINPRTWSLWHKENETPTDALEEWRKKALSAQEKFVEVTYISEQNRIIEKTKTQEVEKEMLIFSAHTGKKDDDIEVINISGQIDSEEEIETQEIKIYPLLQHKGRVWKTSIQDKENKNPDNVLEIKRNRPLSLQNEIKEKALEVIDLWNISTRDDENKHLHNALEMKRYRPLSLQNEIKDKAREVIDLSYLSDSKDQLKKQQLEMPILLNNKTVISAIQSQSSNYASSASKPSTQASNQSSNISVLSPNLLPSQLTFHAHLGNS